jgi:hypothetical protein
MHHTLYLKVPKEFCHGRWHARQDMTSRLQPTCHNVIIFASVLNLKLLLMFVVQAGLSRNGWTSVVQKNQTSAPECHIIILVHLDMWICRWNWQDREKKVLSLDSMSVHSDHLSNIHLSLLHLTCRCQTLMNVYQWCIGRNITWKQVSSATPEVRSVLWKDQKSVQQSALHSWNSQNIGMLKSGFLLLASSTASSLTDFIFQNHKKKNPNNVDGRIMVNGY